MRHHAIALGAVYLAIVLHCLYIYYIRVRNYHVIVLGFNNEIGCYGRESRGNSTLLCIEADAHLLHGTHEALIREGLMQEIDSIAVKAVNRILGIRRREDEGCGWWQMSGYLQAVKPLHLYIKKEQVGSISLDSLKALQRLVIQADIQAAHTLAKLLDNSQSQRLVI